jgi:hypothetical protein
LPTYDGINDIIESENAIYNGKTLIFSGEIENITICDINGRTLPIELSGNSVDIENLERGVYIYTAIIDGKRVNGKFVK